MPKNELLSADSKVLTEETLPSEVQEELAKRFGKRLLELLESRGLGTDADISSAPGDRKVQE